MYMIQTVMTAIVELSGISIEKNAPVPFPDFTRGKWQRANRILRWIWKVCREVRDFPKIIGDLIMKVKFCRTEVEFPSEKLGELRDSGNLVHDSIALKNRLEQDGYLLLRILSNGTVLSARTAIVNHLAAKNALVEGESLLDAVMPRSGKEVRMTARM